MRDRTRASGLAKDSATGLATAAVGSTVRVTGVGLPEAQRLRLAQLGVRTGSTVTVVGWTAGGGRLLGIGTTRLAVDRQTAARLAVAAA